MTFRSTFVTNSTPFHSVPLTTAFPRIPENYWLIEGLEESSSYIFRARAINELGVGPWGKENVIDTVIGPKMLPQTDLPTILASTIPTSFVFIAFLLFCLVYGESNPRRWLRSRFRTSGK